MIEGSHPNTVYLMTIQAIVKKTWYLVDLVKDKVSVFDAANLERVLKEDLKLLDDFMIMRKRKKERLKYVFLTRYNEKYPPCVPIH